MTRSPAGLDLSFIDQRFIASPSETTLHERSASTRTSSPRTQGCANDARHTLHVAGTTVYSDSTLVYRRCEHRTVTDVKESAQGPRIPVGSRLSRRLGPLDVVLRGWEPFPTKSRGRASPLRDAIAGISRGRRASRLRKVRFSGCAQTASAKDPYDEVKVRRGVAGGVCRGDRNGVRCSPAGSVKVWTNHRGVHTVYEERCLDFRTPRLSPSRAPRSGEVREPCAVREVFARKVHDPTARPHVVDQWPRHRQRPSCTTVGPGPSKEPAVPFALM